MKQLLIEEKAKAYDEAKLRMSKAYNENRCTIGFMNEIFPELKESEDERIRKWIIENIQKTLDVDGFFEGQKTMAKNAITWLEKQGKKKFEQKFFINDKVVHKATGKIWTIHHYLKDTNSYYVEDNDGLLHHYTESELKLVEQKPADKVEPKFKVGDKIHRTAFAPKEAIVTEVCNGWYILNDKDVLNFDFEPNWELVEQKPVEEVDGEDYGIDSLWHAIRILEQTLGKIEGYQSDDGILEHKAAITAVKKLYKQKPAEWSEEDEEIHRKCICAMRASACGFPEEEKFVEQVDNWLKSLKDRVLPQPKPEWSEEDEYNTAFIVELLYGIEDSDKEYENKCRKMANWLKSLRPQNWTKEDKERYISCLQRLGTGNPEQPETINSKWFKEHVYPQSTWKPSDEQIGVIEAVINNRSFQRRHLDSLYADLKKLRKEQL